MSAALHFTLFDYLRTQRAALELLICSPLLFRSIEKDNMSK